MTFAKCNPCAWEKLLPITLEHTALNPAPQEKEEYWELPGCLDGSGGADAWGFRKKE
jgi:hypothetical protein